MSGFLEWWADQSPWLRYGAAFAVLGASTAVYFLLNRLWIGGFALGVAMLLLSGPSASEKKGYHF